MGRFYITTPIYYPSANLHIGHAYTTVAADALARFHRLRGDDTWFLTGTDEHGQKMERAAREAGKDPQQFVDEMVARIRELWRVLDISYDDFIRTTEPRHQAVIQDIFTRLWKQGDIYLGRYEGWYCTGCEAYYTETQAKDIGYHCPDHDKPLERVGEDAYFFRLSAYASRLREHIELNPEFIQPSSRRQEMLSFIDQGLEDLCVSRSSFRWGIPVPFAPGHVVYVWIDALCNYISALGYPDGERYRRYWPADVHLVGKEILRFHTIIWPIILMALGEPLPRRVFGHGWLVLESGKMSKTRGNVVDPLVLVDRYGLDAVRYFLLREIPFGADGYYSEEALVRRTNSDLANDLGNLVHRSLNMLTRFAAGRVPAPSRREPVDDEIPALAAEVVEGFARAMEDLQISTALAEVWRLVGRLNKYIDEAAPWALRRAGDERVNTVLYQMAEGLRLLAVLLKPVLVRSAPVLWERVGAPKPFPEVTWDDARWGLLPPGTPVKIGEPLFPRRELGGAVLAGPREAPADGAPREAAADAAPREAVPVARARGDTPGEPDEGMVSIEAFKRLDLRVARVVRAERVPGADRLLRLRIDLGDEERQIVAGIAQHYQPADLEGRSVVVVANLQPAMIRGVESRGMLLAAQQGGRLVLVTIDGDIPAGARVT
ncbi:MAG: methionine--tRNA ligase [Bacillota bacterium]